MDDRRDCSRTQPPSPEDATQDAAADTTDNVFSPEYLDALRRREDEPLTAHEAETRGPWEVVYLQGMAPAITERWAVFRRWEKPGRHSPAGVFLYREHALLYAAALTVSARGSNLSVGLTRDEAGQVVGEFNAATGLTTVGHVAVFDQDAVPVFQVLDGALRNPDALAFVLDAGGVTLAELVGERLAAEYMVEKGDGSED